MSRIKNLKVFADFIVYNVHLDINEGIYFKLCYTAKNKCKDFQILC